MKQRENQAVPGSSDLERIGHIYNMLDTPLKYGVCFVVVLLLVSCHSYPRTRFIVDLNQEKTDELSQTEKTAVSQSSEQHLKTTFQELAEQYDLQGNPAAESSWPDRRLLLSYGKDNFWSGVLKRLDKKIEIVFMTNNVGLWWDFQHHEVAQKIERALKNTYKDRFYEVEWYDEGFWSKGDTQSK